MELLHNSEGLILTIKEFGAHHHFIGLYIIDQKSQIETDYTRKRKHIDQGNNNAQDTSQSIEDVTSIGNFLDSKYVT